MFVAGLAQQQIVIYLFVIIAALMIESVTGAAAAVEPIICTMMIDLALGTAMIAGLKCSSNNLIT